MSMSKFCGRMASLKAEFNLLLPTGKFVAEDLAQRGKFFMVLTLVVISPDITPIRDQILASATMPSLDEVFT